MTDQTFLLQLLEAIDYTDNKEEFVSHFMANIQLELISTLRNTLSPDKQTAFTSAITQEQNNSEKLIQIIKEYFPEAQLQKSYNEIMIHEVTALLESLKDTLSETQKQKVTELINQTIPPHSPSTY